MKLKRLGVISILLLAVAAPVAYLLLPFPYKMKAEWRAKALALKLTGGLPEVSWGKLNSALLPAGLQGNSSSLEIGFVTLNREDPGSGCDALFDTPVGAVWAPKSEESVLELLMTEQLALRIYDRDQVHVAEGDVVVDVGAHLGTFVLYALRKGAARVIAFEPDPQNLTCLKKTFPSEIEDGRLQLIEAAAWREEGELKFLIEPSSTARGHVEDAGALAFEYQYRPDEAVREVVVSATTIDHVINELRPESVDLIKMDIEGSERHALEGARKTLASFGPKLALCVYHREDDAVVIPELVTAIRPEYRSIRVKDQMYFY